MALESHCQRQSVILNAMIGSSFRALVIVVASLAMAVVPAVSAAEDEDPLAPAWQTVEPEVRMSTSKGSHFTRQGNAVKLEEGILVLDAEQAALIETPLARLGPRRKAVVYVKVRRGIEHFFVLLGPAEIKVGKHTAQLNSGEEAIVLDHEPGYSDLVGQDDIGRRRIRMTKLSESESMALSEFSLIQAVEREPMLYRLVHSTDVHDKSVRERLIKMAAVLNIVTGRHGQYSTGVH